MRTINKYRALRKAMVVAIILFPLIMADSSCKKQPRCGCGKDVVVTLSKEPARIYFDVENNTLSFSPIINPSATYYPCNPSAWIPFLSNFTSPAILLVSGEAFYECNYLYNSSNYMYYNPSYRVYQIEISSIEEDLYGKK